jgi:hypothetical protein
MILQAKKKKSEIVSVNNNYSKMGVMVHTCNPSTEETEAGES